MHKYGCIGTLLCLMLVAAPFMGPIDASAASKQTLTAVYAGSAPKGLDDPVWGKAEAEAIPFEGKEVFAGKKASVDTQALFSDDSLYFLFKWKDSTLSAAKEAWQFDGEKWFHQKGNEDRISLLFEINRIDKFATKGCAIVCHVPKGAPNAKDGRFGTTSEAQKGDLWHWKATRSDPAGYADDTWLTIISEKSGGRKNDKGKGGDKKNETEDKSKPKYMLAPDKKLGSHGVLLASHTVEITDYSVFKAGDTLTYRMPVTPDGSRADIRAASRYADGQWTLMLHRKLDTGQEDDLSFNTRKEYNFAMALFDDSGDQDSYDSETITLQFKK